MRRAASTAPSFPAEKWADEETRNVLVDEVAKAGVTVMGVA